MQSGGRGSPCCLQAVTVWIRALRTPLTVTHAPPQAAARPPGTSQRFSGSKPSPDSLLLRPQRSFLPKSLFNFSPRPTLCAEKFALNLVTAEKCGAHARRCHAATGGQGSKGLMGFGGCGARYQSDILINSLDRMTRSLIYLSR